MTYVQTAQAKWQTAKPIVFALAIGLVAGPLISNYMGWQVTRGSAQTQMRENVTEQLAMVCASRAKAEVADTGALDWSARNELAKKWVVAAGAPLADLDVADACARRLAA
ncbi:MAG TPA: hypothetical protein VN823_27055 [Stellaceae bacterium]|nr:hypothetical protein [Stellaceae bacterium]